MKDCKKQRKHKGQLKTYLSIYSRLRNEHSGMLINFWAFPSGYVLIEGAMFIIIIFFFTFLHLHMQV